MSLHVILGPPGAGKAGRAVQVLREAATEGLDAFLCVPGAVDRSRFLRELGGGGHDVVLGVEVGTFDQLVARIAGSPPVRRTDRAMERIVVRDALDGVPAFAAAARWSGFVDTARAQVDRLRRARVWGGAELERAEQELPGEDVAHWRMLEQRVGALLQERRLRDDAWFERRAAAALRARRPGVGAIVVYGFDSLPPSRVELIERCSAQLPVTVALAWRPGRRVHERAAELRDRWRARGAFIEELGAAAAGSAHPVLEWLGTELFEATDAVVPDVGTHADAPQPVAFVDCCGPLQEAQEVVREVALLGSGGCSWDDIAVASADAAMDGELLLSAFHRAGIPARLQVRRRSIDVPAGRAVHELLDAACVQDPIRFVAALRRPVFGLERAVVDAAELRLRGERHQGPSLLRSTSLRGLLRDEMVELLDAAAGRRPAVAAVRRLLASLLPGDVGELDLLRGVAALLEGLVVAAGGEQNLRLVDVRDAIAAFPLAVPDRSDSGAVVIASLEDLRSVAFDAVVLRGMHMGGFRPRVEDEAEAPAAARDLLHLAVTRARRTLRVVRQVAGSDGGHLAPSPAWQELRRLVPDAPLRSRRLGEVVVPPHHVRLDAEVAPAIALARASGMGVDGVDAPMVERVQSLQRQRREGSVTGSLADELANTRRLGVTAVERYATCSAKWFIEQRLRAADPDDDRSGLIEGVLAHAVLQRLVPEAHATALDAGQLRARSCELVMALAADHDPVGVLDRARLERIAEHVACLVEGEAQWQRPDLVEVERSFGRDAPDSIGPGYEVDGVELVGRIDRIDHHGSHVILHDYKYGSTDRSAARLVEDRNLQLLVYWLALEQPGTAFEPVGAVYRAVTKGGAPSGVFSSRLRELGVISRGTRAGVLDDDQRRALLDAAAGVVHEAVAGIRAGRVAPLEDPARCPAHCRLQTICRVGEATR